MNNIIRHSILCISLLLIFQVKTAVGQWMSVKDDCTKKINNAYEAMRMGHPENAMNLPLLDCYFQLSKKDKVLYYELLAQAQLLSNMRINAIESVKRILWLDPDYLPPTSSLPEYRNLFIKNPILHPLAIGGNIGMNNSISLETLSQLIFSSGGVAYFNKRWSPNATLTVEKSIRKNHTIAFSVTSVTRKFNIETYFFQTVRTDTVLVPDKDQPYDSIYYASMDHIQRQVLFPIQYRYQYLFSNKWVPYVGVGLSPGITVLSFQPRIYQWHYDNSIEYIRENADEEIIEISQELRTFNLFAKFEVGLRYMNRLGHYFINASMDQSLIGLRKDASSKSDNLLTFYGDWDKPPFHLRVRSTYFCIGYMLNLSMLNSPFKGRKSLIDRY